MIKLSVFDMMDMVIEKGRKEYGYNIDHLEISGLLARDFINDITDKPVALNPDGTGLYKGISVSISKVLRPLSRSVCGRDSRITEGAMGVYIENS